MPHNHLTINPAHPSLAPRSYFLLHYCSDAPSSEPCNQPSVGLLRSTAARASISPRFPSLILLEKVFVVETHAIVLLGLQRDHHHRLLHRFMLARDPVALQRLVRFRHQRLAPMTSNDLPETHPQCQQQHLVTLPLPLPLPVSKAPQEVLPPTPAPH